MENVIIIQTRQQYNLYLQYEQACRYDLKASLIAVPPKPAIHVNEIRGGIMSTPTTNSLIVRPRILLLQSPNKRRPRNNKPNRNSPY